MILATPLTDHFLEGNAAGHYPQRTPPPSPMHPWMPPDALSGWHKAWGPAQGSPLSLLRDILWGRIGRSIAAFDIFHIEIRQICPARIRLRYFNRQNINRSLHHPLVDPGLSLKKCLGLALLENFDDIGRDAT